MLSGLSIADNASCVLLHASKASGNLCGKHQACCVECVGSPRTSGRLTFPVLVACLLLSLLSCPVMFVCVCSTCCQTSMSVGGTAGCWMCLSATPWVGMRNCCKQRAGTAAHHQQPHQHTCGLQLPPAISSTVCLTVRPLALSLPVPSLLLMLMLVRMLSMVLLMHRHLQRHGYCALAGPQVYKL